MAQNKFSWISFYKEFADNLLAYKADRKTLLNYIYTLDSKYTGYLHEEDGRPLDDICPFTVMGIFNRGTTNSNRIIIATEFKDFLDIKASVPTEFDGIPVLNNQKSHFFGFSTHRKVDDIENLWTLFEKALKDGYDIEAIFDKVITQYIINVNITMGLYWILPDYFIALDSQNRRYLNTYGILVKGKVPQFKEYYRNIKLIKEKMATKTIKEKSFPEFSYNAWQNSSYSVTKEPDPNFDYWEEIVQLLRYKKNIILQGAPGTGKTYDVAEIVVRLCNGLNINHSREAIMEEYKQLVADDRVVFTTFHQSMDYEEFIEGIKPEVVEGQINYITTPGIFKKLCEVAEKPIIEDNKLGFNQNPSIWKVSLMGTYDNPIRTDCLENNRIRIGWDDYGPTLTEDTNYNGGGKIILDAFINKMQIGDIVFSCYTNKIIDAIGVVTGDYEWDDSLPDYKRARSVKWLVKGIKEDIFDLNNKTVMTLSTVYKLNNISLDKVISVLEKNGVSNSDKIVKNEKPYVLVIDEINRGNISKIFAELITLLESDKRAGEENEIKVTLPYSKTEFSVPSNIFIIGTMNTADRSLGYIDYAIRRRFAFVDMNPMELGVDGFDKDLFKEISELFIKDYDSYLNNLIIEPSDYLSEEFRPEDVWIGQSYFIMNDLEGYDVTFLRLNYEIIPILKEYIKDGIFKDIIAVEQKINDLKLRYIS